MNQLTSNQSKKSSQSVPSTLQLSTADTIHVSVRIEEAVVRAALRSSEEAHITVASQGSGRYDFNSITAQAAVEDTFAVLQQPIPIRLHLRAALAA